MLADRSEATCCGGELILIASAEEIQQEEEEEEEEDDDNIRQHFVTVTDRMPQSLLQARLTSALLQILRHHKPDTPTQVRTLRRDQRAPQSFCYQQMQ